MLLSVYSVTVIVMTQNVTICIIATQRRRITQQRSSRPWAYFVRFVLANFAGILGKFIGKVVIAAAAAAIAAAIIIVVAAAAAAAAAYQTLAALYSSCAARANGPRTMMVIRGLVSLRIVNLQIVLKVVERIRRGDNGQQIAAGVE